MKNSIKKLLPLVEKPARYVGGEFNIADMNKPSDCRVCLCFPDVYEVGMSNIGMRILYGMLNEKPGVVCERCFTPMIDLGDKMLAEKIELFSIETKKEVKAFDVVGFSIGYEMLYTNVLYMLELADIPFYSKDRDDNFPLLIAGGPCAVNPEPFADFFDAIMIGDGEVNLNLFIDKVREMKAKKASKKEILTACQGIEGVYIPSIDCTEGRVDVIKRAVVKDLDNAYFPTGIVVPNIEIVHDRCVIELYRGCANGCRFCQACFYYRPIRFRKTDTLICQAQELIEKTGYNEISLASLSTGDYYDLNNLVEGLVNVTKKYSTKLSLPSLRLDSYKNEYIAKTMRKGSLTFAPEAGTQRLRDVINKNISDEDIENTITEAIGQGYKSVKLYFMIGLPTETQEDIEGIVEIVKKVKNFSNQRRRKDFNIVVSTSVFIPKPLTPFQWSKQISIEEMFAKQDYLKANLRINGVKYNWHSAHTAVIEAILARGDKKLSKLIENAYKKGCRFDGWSEHFNREFWQSAIAETDIDVNDYIGEQSLDAPLAWDFIDNGVKKEYLVEEYKKAVECLTTPACSKDNCLKCGANKLGGCYKI